METLQPTEGDQGLWTKNRQRDCHSLWCRARNKYKNWEEYYNIKQTLKAYSLAGASLGETEGGFVISSPMVSHRTVIRSLFVWETAQDSLA